ncbi:hypothetical protein BD324DRAFT_512844 [Kockovaella imperatae]|uniref:Uncharacterized protein n=1 Tax=Kockovaella imperatae TaxID=4999 RepID=A0A1Y1UD62_9TREE|nr:hypothetical protein BD324DRAFT_512844 [Kockovaella imperatae]ORX35952.1 hypothetical protein BD324DRAFT_512844 [Kockovaella imperatae]
MTTMASSTATQVPNWDGQIVPALKKRLEGESVYLSSRLSGTNFPEAESSIPAPAPSGPSSSKPAASSIPRARTKSTPLAIGPGPAARPGTSSNKRWQEPSNIPVGVRSPHASGRQAKRDPSLSTLSPDLQASSTLSPPAAIPSASSSRRPSLDAPRSEASSSSQIIHRQRSKSSLGPRPSVSRSPRDNGSTHIMPSSIPVYTGRLSPNRSPGRSPHPSPGQSSILDFSDSGRNSLELDSGSKIREGFIKNELPPFRMMPDEAMRIAENGHDIQDEDDQFAFGLMTDEEEGDKTESPVEMSKEHQPGDFGEMPVDKRKRAETMKAIPSKKATRPLGTKSTGAATLSARPSTGSASSKISGLPRSATTGLGFGHPSTRVAGPSKGRSASGQPTGSASVSALSGSRSASMNVLASQPSSTFRLGVAAHLIPPENPYTPPKGVNPETMPVPTVAKRLEAEAAQKSGSGPQDDDLVVEWDKNGKPIKWIKWNKKNEGGLGSSAEQDQAEASGETLKGSALGPNASLANQSPATSFEHHLGTEISRSSSSKRLAPKRSTSSLRQGSPSPSIAPPLPNNTGLDPSQQPGSYPLRPKRSAENIPLATLGNLPRTASGPSNTFHDSSVGSHGASTSYGTPSAPMAEWGTPIHRQPSPDKLTRSHSTLLKKDKSGSMSRQHSASGVSSGEPSNSANDKSIDRRGAHGPTQSFDGMPKAYGDFNFGPLGSGDPTIGANGGSRPVPITPGTTHMIQETAYKDKYKQPAAPRGKSKDDHVDKGCGCVVM